MSETHNLKKLQYDGKEIVAEVANRDTSGKIIKDTYVDKNTDQTIIGRKRFDVTPQIFDHYEITSKNLFRKNFNIFDNTGGTGTAYAYFKLPDDGKNYTLSVRLKDSTKSFGRGNVFGWTTYGGTSGGSLGWLAQGDTINSQYHVFYANDTARFISLYSGNATTFDKLLARYYIQLEEGTTMTEYVDPDSGIENIYVDVAKVNEIPTKTSELVNDSGYITNAYHDSTKANQSEVNIIQAKIPSAASSSNQLADKAFVNSSIETATATFRGTYTTLEALQAATGDLNDYAFYNHTDAAGNTVFDRYKYTTDIPHWVYEYTLNNSSFTAAQWAAINSGVTAGNWVDMSTTQTINGQKNFNTVPTVRVESYKGAHNLPDEYQELQYISSLAGSGVISTTLAVDTATYYAVIRASLINFTGSYGTIMGNNSAPQIAFNRTQWYVGNAGGNGQATPPAFNGTIYTLRYSYNGIGDYYVDGNDTGLRRTGSLGLTFFSNSSTGTGDNAAANIYIAEIYRRSDNELIYQFIPARSNSSNQLGFYETVNNIFYSGVGITAGPEDQSGEVIIQYLPVLTGGNFAPVAFTGSYNDLIGTPTIPIVNNGTLTIQKNGTTITTFTANQSTNNTANITVPTTTSDLTNDSGFITDSDIPIKTISVNNTQVLPVSENVNIDLYSYHDATKQNELIAGNDITLTNVEEIGKNKFNMPSQVASIAIAQPSSNIQIYSYMWYFGFAYNGNINKSTIRNYSLSDNTISFKSSDAGSYGICKFIQLKPNTTYTLSVTYISGSTTVGKMALCKYKLVSNNTYKFNKYIITPNNLPKTFTTEVDDDGDYLYGILLYATTANTECTYSNIQIEEGSSVTSYVPYASVNKTIVDSVADIYPVENKNYRIQFKVVNGQPQLEYEEVV